MTPAGKIVQVKGDYSGALWNIELENGKYVLPNGVFDREICAAILRAMISREALISARAEHSAALKEIDRVVRNIRGLYAELKKLRP